MLDMEGIYFVLGALCGYMLTKVLERYGSRQSR